MQISNLESQAKKVERFDEPRGATSPSIMGHSGRYMDPNKVLVKKRNVMAYSKDLYADHLGLLAD